jgi:myo-inositol-1-phosphate synthase
MRVAIVGVGNCCCALMQALDAICVGELTHTDVVPGLSDVDPTKIEIVAAFDIDRRKVGLPLHDAIFAEPNCTTRYRDPRPSMVTVTPGSPQDGVDGPLDDVVQLADGVWEVMAQDVARVLTQAQASIVVLYLPVGSQAAAEFYASAALAAGCSLVNCTPAVLGNSPAWRARFAESGLVLTGDDMKSNIGSTTVHQALLELLRDRGAEVTSTYQLNIGGNTDFLNMRDTSRAAAKRATKATALGALLEPGTGLGVGPSDHIPHLRDHKVGYIHIEAVGYLGMPLSIELRLEVEDSPNAAPVAIDAIRLTAAMRGGADLDADAAMARLFKAPGIHWVNGQREPKGVNLD